ncbi:MAG: DUF6268 family outer membrane beta-barrel protein [Luteibaculaceae bacterium]
MQKCSKLSLITLFLFLGIALKAQTDSIPSFPDDDDDDYSLYDNFESVDDKPVKRYASTKIIGQSPQRFASVGWDAQLNYNMRLSDIGEFAPGSDMNVAESGNVNYTGGIRLNTAIPIISKSNITWQSGLNFMDFRYRITDIEKQPGASGLTEVLNETGLRNLNWTNTVFKPLDETTFLLFQVQTDLSGNFGWDLQSLSTVRYSAAVLWGKRPSDRKQWAVGLSRTYRVGNMNYIPVVMYNSTSASRKWGSEILFPARAHGRYTINKDNLILFGYELEGQSYRIEDFSTATQSFEIRRGELRPRIEYQKKLFGYFWLGIQTGLRYDWSFDADFLEGDNEFFRGFFGNQPFAMRNELGNAFYFNFSISFVSP